MRDKPHTELARRVLYGIKNTGPELTLAPTEDVAGFNLRGSYPETAIEQTVSTTSVRITYQTDSGALGFAVVRAGYVTLYATGAAEFTLENGRFGAAELGSYASGEFVKSGDAAREGDKIILAGKQVCRVKIDAAGEALVSDTLSQIAANR